MSRTFKYKNETIDFGRIHRFHAVDNCTFSIVFTDGAAKRLSFEDEESAANFYNTLERYLENNPDSILKEYWRGKSS